MKKTIIALLALGGVAGAATVDDALLGISNFAGTDSTININNTGVDSLSVVDSTTKDGYLEISGADFSYNTYKDNGGGKRAYVSLTLVVDLAKLTTPASDTILFLDNVNGDTDALFGWGSSLTTGRTLKGVWDGEVWNNNNNYTTSALGTTGTAVLTFNTGWPGTPNTNEGSGDACYSEVYLNGTLVSGDKGKGLAHGTVINAFYVNETYADAIQELYIHNSMVRGDGAKALYNSIVGATVPEPTTATLSLLALAGLAARRRRK